MDVQHGPDNQWPGSSWPDARWLMAIDACRPASDDVSLSELHELAAELATNPRLAQVYDRIQSLDAAIARAAVDVPVPEGLHGRLLASLAAAALSPAAAALSAAALSAAAADSSPAAAVSSPAAAGVVPAAVGASPTVEAQAGNSETVLVTPASVTPASVALQESPRKVFLTRRSPAGRSRAGWSVAGLALAASVAWAAFYLNRPAPQEISADEVMQLAIGFHDETYDADSPAALTVSGSGDKEYPLSTALALSGTIKGRTVSDFLGRGGVAYDMTRQGGVRATLYVVDLAAPRSAPQLAPVLPIAPLGTPLDTGGRTVAVWQESGLLYVLVVDGELPAYRMFVPPAGPVAFREISRPAWLAGNRAPIGRGRLFGKVSLI